MHNPIFNDTPCQGLNIAPCDGELYWQKQFYAPQQADELFAQLNADCAWQAEEILVYGKWHNVPRLMCWYGDADAFYRYSGVNHQPLPWTPTLLTIKEKVQQHCQCEFNSVLLNLYRDGQDSMGYHADDEKELGENPMIASLSFGAERLFKLQHKSLKITLDIRLAHGDLLIMAGTIQQHWRHALPKTKQPKTPRINLTFRQIVAL
ncbi:MAG: alpha-ketoglutarate-dependent dioxygenase AlkB [Methylococcales bacterium]|nr:alpha-ketoglutarate-dependent dioxygenase AlkB [Methylococcales bacterium]